MQNLLERLRRASEEAESLLQKNDDLSQESSRLYRRGAMLTREIVRLGRAFCERLPPKESALDAEANRSDERFEIERFGDDVTDVAEALPGSLSR